MTGLNLKALTALQPSFAQALAEAPIPRRSQQPRERSVGGGRKPRLVSVEDKLIYILFYFKCYPTFDLAGPLFDLDRSQANRWMHRLLPEPTEATPGELTLALDNRDYQNLQFDLSADGQTIVVQRVNRDDPANFGPWVLRTGKAPFAMPSLTPAAVFSTCWPANR